MRKWLFGLGAVAVVVLFSGSANAQNGVQPYSMASEVKCHNLGYKFDSPEMNTCRKMVDSGITPDNQNLTLSSKSTADAHAPKNTTSTSYLTDEFMQTCNRLGFQERTSEHSQCAMALYQAKQQADADQRLYQLQLKQFEAEQTRLAEAKRDRARRESQARWQALQRFFAGMGQSQSPTFGGALADANAAMLGLPPARQSSGYGAAPQAPVPQDITIRTPDGRLVRCDTFGGMITCR